MRALFQDPAYLEMRRQVRERAAAEKAAGVRTWSRQGVPDGWTRDTAQKEHKRAERSARKTVRKMIENDVVEKPADAVAAERYEESMVATLAVMRDKTANNKEKLAAARQVMEWTKAKPESARKISVQSAEDWLAACIEDAKE
jgi:hypothetical protein